MQDLSIFAEVNEELLSNTDALKQLVDFSNEAVQLEEQAASIEELQKKLNGRLNTIKTQIIPKLMAMIGQIDFTLTNGFKVTIEDFIAVQDIKDKAKKQAMRERRIATLADMEGGEALIKTEVSLPFEKKQHNEALALVDELRKRGLIVEVSSDVNIQSLKSFVREKMRAGEEVDQEKLGLFIGTSAKIINPEKK